MDAFVFTAVLLAAACHAGWNAVIKRGLDPLATTALISVGAAAVGLATLPLVGLPAPASWPWAIASVLIHLVYFVALIESYRVGDMSQVYPIARGSAPLMTAVATTRIGRRAPWHIRLVRHRPAGGRRAADLVARRSGPRAARPARGRICAVHGGDDLRLFGGRRSRRAQLPAIANAYSVVLFVGIGPVMAIYALARSGPALFGRCGAIGAWGLTGGALQFGSYASRSGP